MLLLFPLALALFTWIVMLLWNGVLAEVTGVHVVSFWQAMGILVLSKILFGGFRGGWRGKRHEQMHDMKDKWQQMTPEERVQFKQQWRDRCKTWGRGRFEQKPPEENISES